MPYTTVRTLSNRKKSRLHIRRHQDICVGRLNKITTIAVTIVGRTDNFLPSPQGRNVTTCSILFDCELRNNYIFIWTSHYSANCYSQTINIHTIMQRNSQIILMALRVIYIRYLNTYDVSILVRKISNAVY